MDSLKKDAAASLSFPECSDRTTLLVRYNEVRSRSSDADEIWWSVCLLEPMANSAV